MTNIPEASDTQIARHPSVRRDDNGLFLRQTGERLRVEVVEVRVRDHNQSRLWHSRQVELARVLMDEAAHEAGRPQYWVE
jgi:hypothetical protein